MRLDINLASQPYEDARQFWLRWGTAVAGVAIVTLILVSSTLFGWYSARRDHAKIADLQKQIDQRNETKRTAEEILSRPENHATRDDSQFLNQLIERKSFSWTRVLENLEKVMPPRVHLVSINPELDEDNQLALKMVVAGNSRERALELPRRMEDSHRFARTDITEETHQQSTNGDTDQFHITAFYIPEVAGAQAAAIQAADAPKPPTQTSPQARKRSKR
jgi:type IV pilus assembly protein PilN